MKKLRSVNTKFWGDSFIESINPSEKLLFLYLLTNPLTNVLGIYEISLKRIMFDTGLNQTIIQKALKGFQTIGKVYYIDGFIILPNFIKNQSMNPNMKTGAVNSFNELPEKIRQLSEFKEDVKCFETLLKALQGFEKSKCNIKFNCNSNSKIKGKGKNYPKPTFIDVENYFKEKGFDNKLAVKFFEYYELTDWLDSNDNTFNWKQKALSWINSEKGKETKKEVEEIYYDRNGL